MKDHRADVRHDGCQELEAIGESSTLGSLRELEDDDQYEVRMAALMAIRDIAEREIISLTDEDQRLLQQVNIEYSASNDVEASD